MSRRGTNSPNKDPHYPCLGHETRRSDSVPDGSDFPELADQGPGWD